MEAREYDYLFKFLLVGDPGVGKTALLQRYAEDKFPETYQVTVGVESKLRTISVGERRVKLQIWDRMGQGASSCNTYRGAHAIVVVFDVTSLGSFNNIKSWLQEIDRYACEDVDKLLVGNGCDKATRTVTKQMAEEFADPLGIAYVETSAKTGTGVEDAFMTAAQAVKSRMEAITSPPIPPVRTTLADRLFNKEKLKKLEEERAKRKEERRSGFDDPFDS